MRQEPAGVIARAGLSPSVRLIGHRLDVERWLRVADLFVLTSHHEGLSNATLEAMASGLPVVCTRVSGSAELLGETGAGLIAEVGRMDQVADAVARLACDPSLREQMGEIGRQVVEKYYSIDHVTEAHLRLYRRLLSGSVPPGEAR